MNKEEYIKLYNNEEDVTLTDEDVDNINKLIKTCRYRIKDFGMCKMAILPCERAIDKGKCMTIIEYMDKRARVTGIELEVKG